jgi:predicted ATPase
MRLAKVRLKNFRCYKEEIGIEIDNLTVIVGKNDAGKSAILDALAIFFEETKIDADDAYTSGDPKDVRIICEFDDLPKSLILDADHPTSLEEEYLLNENGRLEIHKVYNTSLKTPKLSAVYASALHPSAPQRDDLLLLKNNQLKERAKKLGLHVSEVDSRINTELRRLIWNSADELQLKKQEIPLDKETAKQIWDQLSKYLPCYAVFKSDRPSTDQDAEVQDPMKAAVKEALKEKETDLENITKYVEKEVQAIAQKTIDKLNEMDPNLASRLRPQFTPPNWASVFKINLIDDHDVPINKRGSGVRRLILLNFFRAKAEQLATKKGAQNIIYAIEEPETSQHPNNQKMLVQAFYDLSDQPKCQVIITTHTPVMARLLPASCIRYIEIKEDRSRAIHQQDEETYRLAVESLGILSEHDVKIFIGVEGINDINFLKGISHILHQAGEDVINLKQMEEDGKVIFFPLGGTNLTHWASRLRELYRPEFYIFDREVEPPAIPSNQEVVDAINARPNCYACFTSKKEMENYIHPAAIKAALDVDITFSDFDDVPKLVARKIHELSGSDVPWDNLPDNQKKEKERKAKARLNTLAVECMTPELLSASDPRGDVRSWLARIKEMIDNN